MPLQSPLAAAPDSPASSRPTSIVPLAASRPSTSPQLKTLRLPKPPPPPKPLYLSVRAGRPPPGKAGQVPKKEAEAEEGEGAVRVSGGRRVRPRRELPRWAEQGPGEAEGSVADEEDGVVKAGPEQASGPGATTALASPLSSTLQGDGGGEPRAESDHPVEVESAAPGPPSQNHSTASTSSSASFSTPVGTLRLQALCDVDGRRYSTLRFRDDEGQLNIFFDPRLHNPFVRPSPPPEREPSVSQGHKGEPDAVDGSSGSEDPKDGAPSSGSATPTHEDETANGASEDHRDDSAPPKDLSSPEEATSLPRQDSELLRIPAEATAAVALHAFSGLAAHGELSFPDGAELRIEVEDVGGGWSLGYLAEEGEVGRGLIPRAWYAYVDTVSLEQHVADERSSDGAGYASCSIRRPVVISGVEFEPTWLENENATVTISEPSPYTALATTHAGATTRFSRSFTSSLLNAVGSTFSLSLPFSFGGLVVPGASILAATSAPTFDTASYSRRKRLPRLERNAAGLKPQELLLRWIDDGDDLDDDLDDSTQTYEIDDGPAWRPRDDRPAYSVVVSSPEVVSPADERAHVLYRVVTTFVPHHSPSDVDDSEPEPLDVQRRFSDFAALEALLKARFLYPLVCIPSLPPRSDLTFGASRFDRGFLLPRARGLQVWLDRCRRHPVLGDSEELKGFLRIEDRLDLARHLRGDSLSEVAADCPLFPARVFHPEFNIDVADARQIGNRFSRRCVEASAQRDLAEVAQAVNAFQSLEQRRTDSITQLSSALLAMLPPSAESSQETQFGSATFVQSATLRNVTTVLSSLSFPQAEQAHGGVAGIDQLLEDTRRIAPTFKALSALHEALVAKYRTLSSTEPAAAEQLARCETALNIVCAEMQHQMRQSAEQVREVVKDWLISVARRQEADLRDTRAVLSLFSVAK